MLHFRKNKLNNSQKLQLQCIQKANKNNIENFSLSVHFMHSVQGTSLSREANKIPVKFLQYSHINFNSARHHKNFICFLSLPKNSFQTFEDPA